ncbi:MAG: hypothetical protein MJ220_04140 [Bacilli bacterium]|nr:hypothetical protein [Bacilli bacterium]
MKKKCLLLLIPLLLACGTNNTSSESIVDSSVDSSISSSELSEADKQKQEVLDFAAKLEAKSGHVNHIEAETYTEYGYATVETDSYMTIEMWDEFTSDRYITNDGKGLVVRNGTVTSSSGSEKYTSQIFKNFLSWIKLTDYESPENVDLKQSIKAATTEEEAILSLSFATQEVANLIYLSNFFGLEESNEIFVKYDLPAELPENGEISYSYSLTSYEQSLPDEKITHEVKAMFKNGQIIASYSSVNDSLYGGTRKPVNYSLSESSVDYTEGEYGVYEGELFNPENFTEVNN